MLKNNKAKVIKLETKRQSSSLCQCKDKERKQVLCRNGPGKVFQEALVRAQRAHPATRPATPAPAALRCAAKGKELLKLVTFCCGLLNTEDC